MKTIFFDKFGKPIIDVLEFEKLLSHKIIKQDTLPDGKWVSTVWLGTDYSFGESGTPLIFETMVFPKKYDFQDLDMQRYSTLEEAKQGHEAMIKKYTN